METEIQTEKRWYENFEVRTYKGVEYIMYKTTPLEAEQKIKDFLDSIRIQNYLKVDVVTEGSECVLLDLWLSHNYVDENDLKPCTKFIINRHQYKNNKYAYRIRNIL